MPNWCDTTYKCVGKKEDIKALHDILEEMGNSKKPIISNGFGNMWLGCLVHKLGYNWKECACRGEVLDYYLDDDGTMLVIAQETAWCEQEGVREAIKKAYPDVKVYYREEEPGCGIFCTNDDTGEYFPDKYYIDSTVEELSDYYISLKDLIAKFKEVTGQDDIKTEEQLKEAVEKYNEKLADEDGFCYLWVFEQVNDEP